jgi:hypothetical protein
MKQLKVGIKMFPKIYFLQKDVGTRRQKGLNNIF